MYALAEKGCNFSEGKITKYSLTLMPSRCQCQRSFSRKARLPFLSENVTLRLDFLNELVDLDFKSGVVFDLGIDDTVRRHDRGVVSIQDFAYLRIGKL